MPGSEVLKKSYLCLCASVCRCVCMSMCLCTLIHMQVHMCACTHVWIIMKRPKATSGVILQVLLILGREGTESLTGLEFTK